MVMNSGLKWMRAVNDGRWHQVPEGTTAVYTVTVKSTSTTTGE